MSADIRIGVDILNTEVAQKTRNITCQTGDVVNEDVESHGVEWIQHVGFISRPPKPAAGRAACQGVIIVRGGRDTCVASQDARGQELAGSLKDGETCLYGPGEHGTAQGRVLLKQNGSINIYTRKDNEVDGEGMGIFVNPEDDSISIVNSQGFGLLIKADGVYLTSKDAGLKLGTDGAVSLVGKGPTKIDGTTITLGTPIPVVGAVIHGVSGIAGAPSVKVFTE